MASIYIRDLPDELVRGIRSKAALSGKTLKEYLAPFLQLALEGDVPKLPTKADIRIEYSPAGYPMHVDHGEIPASHPKSRACKECGALVGHQRGCKSK